MCTVLHLGKGSPATYNIYEMCSIYGFKIWSDISYSQVVTPYILLEVNIDYSEKHVNSKKNRINWFWGVLKGAGSCETFFLFLNTTLFLSQMTVIFILTAWKTSNITK